MKQETPDPLHIPLGELKGSMHQDDFRPSWRGWIHTGVLPFVIAAGIVLVVLAEGWIAKTASAIFFASSVLLFGNSALYHRFRWKPFAKKLLKRIDHANIFLLIAGSYTPICFSAMQSDAGLVLLVVIWTIAILGISFRIFWISAPRWLYVPIYLAMGWAAVFYLPDLFAVSFEAMSLIVIGGLLYSVGAVIYGLKKPNPFPKHFGFHEIFHALTVVAFICHWSAALIIGLDPIPGSLSDLA